MNMKKCNSCGKECNDYENYCSNCGGSNFTAVEQYAPENTVNQNQTQYADNKFNENQPNNTYNQNQYYGNPNQNTVNDNQFNNNTNNQYYNPYDNYQQPNQFNQFNQFEAEQKADKSNIEDAKVCGIVSLVIIFIGLIGLSWIPALIGNNKLKKVTHLRGTSDFDTARLLNKIGMILSIIAIVFFCAVVFFQLVVLGIGMGSVFFNDYLMILPMVL